MRPERGAHHRGNRTPERRIDLTGVAEPSRNAGMVLDRNDRDDLKKTSARDWEKTQLITCLQNYVWTSVVEGLFHRKK